MRIAREVRWWLVRKLDDIRLRRELKRQAEPFGGDVLAMLRATSEPCESVEDLFR